MAWRLDGAKPLSEPMMVSLPTHIYVTRPQWVKCDNDKKLLNLPFHFYCSQLHKISNLYPLPELFRWNFDIHLQYGKSFFECEILKENKMVNFVVSIMPVNDLVMFRVQALRHMALIWTSCLRKIRYSALQGLICHGVTREIDLMEKILRIWMW